MNAVFIHVPKTAGLYIQEALDLEILRFPHRAKKNFKQSGVVTFGHQDYPRLLKRGVVGRAFHDSAFRFAFCRNPYDRAVSHYFYVRKKHPERMDKGVSFIDYTRTLASFGRTFQPQSVYLRGLALDFLGRFERLEADLAEVAGLLGREVKDTPKRNETKHGPYWEYYNEEAAENIRQYYREDFERFKYDDSVLH